MKDVNQDNQTVFWTSPKNIHPAPFNPATRTEKSKLLKLAESLREFGMKDPLDCYKENNKLFVIDGNRRLAGSLIAEMRQVPYKLWTKDQARQIYLMNRLKKSFTGEDWLNIYYSGNGKNREYIPEADRDRIEGYIEKYGNDIVKKAAAKNFSYYAFRDITTCLGKLEMALDEDFTHSFAEWVVTYDQRAIANQIRREKYLSPLALELVLTKITTCMSEGKPLELKHPLFQK